MPFSFSIVYNTRTLSSL